MKVRASTLEDLDVAIAVNDYYDIKVSILQALVSSKYCVSVVNDEGKVLAMAVGNPMVHPSACGLAFRCIFVYSTSNEDKKLLLYYLKNLYSEVALSRQCMDYCELDYNRHLKGDWFEIKCITTKIPDRSDIKSKVTSSLYYNPAHIELLKVIDEILLHISQPSCSDNYFTNKQVDLISKLSDHMVYHGNGIYTFPMISKTFLKRLHKYQEKKPYKVNDSEVYDVQIPEIVLDTDEPLYEECRNLFINTVVPLAKILFDYEVKWITSIQFAKYDSNSDISGGNWHKDEDSEVTLTINVSDEDFECEGTLIKPWGIEKPIKVPAVPVGHAMLFRGRQFEHKGMPVTKGVRKLLVFWTS